MTSISINAPLASLMVVALVGLLLGKWVTGRWYNPISVLGGAWAVVTVAYALEGSALYPLRSHTAVVVGAGLLAIMLGAFFTYSLSGVGHARPAGQGKQLGAVPYDEAALAKVYRRLCIALTCYLALQVAQIAPLLSQAGGLSEIFGGSSGLDFRRAYLSQRIASTQAGFGGGGLLLAALGYVLFLGALSLVPAGYYAATGRGKKALYPLGIMAGYSVLMLERSSFIYSAGLFACSYFYHRVSRADGEIPGRQKRGSKIAVSLTVGLVVVVAVLPVVIRSAGSRGDVNGQGDALSYITTGLAGLNGADGISSNLTSPVTGQGSPVIAEVARSSDGLGSGYGVWTMYGAVSILDRLGVGVEAPPLTFAYVVTGPQRGSISNIYTFAIYPYYDFGPPGVVLFGLLAGVIAAALDLQIRRKGNFAAVVPAAVLLTTFAMSFFGLALVRDFRYLFLCLAGYYVMSRLRPRDSSPHPVRSSRARAPMARSHASIGESAHDV